MTRSDTIINRIKTLCDNKHITIHKLSVLSGLPESTVRYFMSGSIKTAPRIDTLHKIATGLGMTLSEFFDFPEMNDTIFNDE